MGESVGLVTGWSWVRIPLRQLLFGTLAIPFSPLCQCLSEETLKAIGPFYLVSMPGEVNYSTSLHCTCVTCRGFQFECSQYRIYNTMQCNAMRCGAMRCGAVRCGAVQCSTVQYSTVQYSTVKYNTIQYNTIQYSV